MKNPHTRRKRIGAWRKQRGFTLTEVLIAIVILLVGIVAVAQLVPVSERDASALLERLEAELAAVEAMRENIKALIRRTKKRLREYAVKRRDRPA